MRRCRLQVLYRRPLLPVRQQDPLSVRLRGATGAGAAVDQLQQSSAAQETPAAAAGAAAAVVVVVVVRGDDDKSSRSVAVGDCVYISDSDVARLSRLNVGL